jgi:uncharacterized protein (TIGR00251 family)
MAIKYISIKVQARAGKIGMEECHPGEYKVMVRSAPVKGEANREVIQVIADFFKVPASRVKIVRGAKSRRKLIALQIDDSE